jgi:acetyltransferase-like isoleucine patch superfamily enzyme
MSDPFIHETARIGESYRFFQGGKAPYGFDDTPVSFGKNVWIGAYTVVGNSVQLGSGVVIDHYCVVEPGSILGDNTLLIYRAVVGCGAQIGKNCVIGGFISENCLIENDCRIFGKIVHRHINTKEPWDEHEVPEPSATICNGAFIGFEAMIIGGVTIGANSYVAAGAIVTRDVPPRYVAINRNEFIPISKWKGPLKYNPAMR